MYAPQHLEELSGVYGEIADDLRIEYLLSYTPTNTAQSEGWHSIRVQIMNHPEAVIRTREGYYMKKKQP